MEDLALLDLLECPLCLDPLDVTAKVLPCQHTFCKSCLQRQESSSSRAALRCPECRSPVAGTVEELPTNVLLVRLLEGLRHGPLELPVGDWEHVDSVELPKDGSSRKGHHHDNNNAAQSDEDMREQGFDRVPPQPRVVGSISQSPPRLDQLSNTPHPSMRSGGGGGGVMDVGQKEENEKTRHYAELAKPGGGGGGGGGGLHATNVTIYRTGGSDHPQPLQPQPLCTALYDFNTRDLDPQDCKDCLTFFKGDVITVLKRVDDKWIEGMLGDKVGIFPLQFAELNPVARQLLDRRQKEGIESTTTAQTESSSSSSRPTFARRSSGREHKRGSVNVNSTNASTNVNAHLAALRRHASFSAAHRTTSSSRPTTTSTTHVNLLNSLNKPPAAVPVPGLVYAPQPLVPVSAQAPKAATAAAPLVPVSVSSRPVRALQGSFKHHRSSSLRRSLHQSDRKMNGGESQASTITMALIDPQEHVDKTHNTQQLSISVCAALYSYKPQHSEELELRKGEMVGVYGKFKEGWLRGLSLRTGKVGILPSNYVTPVLRTSARFVESKPINPSSLTNSSSSSSNGAVGTGTGTGRRHGHGHGHGHSTHTHTHTQKPSVGNSTTTTTTIMEHQQQHQQHQHHQQQVTLTDPNGVTTAMGMGHGLPQPITQVSMAGQHTVTSHSGMRSGGGHSGAKHGWDIVRRAFHSTHRGLVQRASHRSHSHSHLTPSLQPRSSGPDLGQIYTYGRSPVLPRKRNGLFSNQHGGARQQCWTTETLPPPSGGYQAFHRDLLPPSLPLSSGNNNNHTSSSSSGPLHSILVKPESKHNTDKPAKSVRFLTEDPAPPPQLSSWTSSLPSFARQPQYSSGPQSNTSTTTTTTTTTPTPIMELWNPSAILGRDGNSSVLRDFKSSSNNNSNPLRKDTGFGHAYGDGSPFTLKSSGSQSSPSRHRVAIGYSAKTDAEMSLSEGDIVLVQRPRQDGRILVTQESTGRTGLFQGTVLGCLDKIM